jgi:hypothetical protein
VAQMHWQSQTYTRASKTSFKNSHQMSMAVRRWDISGTTERNRARISGMPWGGAGSVSSRPLPQMTAAHLVRSGISNSMLKPSVMRRCDVRRAVPDVSKDGDIAMSSYSRVKQSTHRTTQHKRSDNIKCSAVCCYWFIYLLQS